MVERVGQQIFRDGLLEYWQGRCAITGLAVAEVLRASHIKPWAECATDAERLDVFNGLLLAPNLDAAFDRGFITVAENGEVLVSERLGDPDRRALGLDVPYASARWTIATRPICAFIANECSRTRRLDPSTSDQTDSPRAPLTARRPSAFWRRPRIPSGSGAQRSRRHRRPQRRPWQS